MSCFGFNKGQDSDGLKLNVPLHYKSTWSESENLTDEEWFSETAVGVNRYILYQKDQWSLVWRFAPLNIDVIFCLD